jgi:integrase
MTVSIMPLSDRSIANAKPKDKAYKLADELGLYLLVSVTGNKAFKYDYRLDGKRGTYTIGSYPRMSLSEAREEHRKARELVARGLVPIAVREEQKSTGKRFSYYFNEWLRTSNSAPSTKADIVQRVNKNLLPYLDAKPIEQWDTRELYDLLMKVSDRARETALRLAGVLNQIFKQVFVLNLISVNPAAGLSDLLPKPDKLSATNFAHITKPEELGNLLKQIDSPPPKQDFVVTQALKLMPLLFLRPINIRFLKWEYVDFEAKIINLPATELKTRKPLQVPLARQALEILEQLKPLTGHLEYVFIATRSSSNKPISEATCNNAIKRMINPETNEPYGTGFMTTHGFRHTASTFLNELGFDPDVIELQLAHINKDRIRATYNKAQLIEKRIDMMQKWANYLDELKK